MDVTPLIAEGQQIIQSYAAGVFRISGVTYKGAVLVWPHQTIEWQSPINFSDISSGSFDVLVQQSNDIDVVLFGTGASMKFLHPELRQQLQQSGLSVDVMDTGAACRTYNVLMAEGRRVVAALLPSFSQS